MRDPAASDYSLEKRRSSSPWFILTVLLFAGMAATVNYYKVPPLMPVLMGAFHLTGGKAGFLMAIFAVVGITLSLPAGFIVNRLGYRAAGLTAIGFVAAGAGLGGFATSVAGLLATRFMEGIGLTLTAVVSPTIITHHFPSRNRPAALGIWSAWYPLGSTIIFVVAPLLNSLWGWQSVWWFGSLFAIAVGFLYFFSIKPLPVSEMEKGPSDTPSAIKLPGNKETLFNRDVWKLSVMFLSFAFMYVAFVTWTPTFLHLAKGVPLTRAALIMSIFSVLALVSSPSSGWFLGRVRSGFPAAVFVIATFTAFAISVCFVRVFLALPVIIIMGIIASFIPAICVAAAAQLMHEGKVNALALSAVTTGQNAGILIGPTVFGWAMGSTGGWTLAYATFVPVGLLGMGAGLLLARGRKVSPSVR